MKKVLKLCGFAPRLIIWLAMVIIAHAALADEVQVREYTVAGAMTNLLTTANKPVGAHLTTQTAPNVNGYIFTHWTSDGTCELERRDEWGRALNVANYTLSGAADLTAHYLPTNEDSDEDGVADGYEIYWYGSLDQDGASDTDGDGRTFAEEIAAGTSPLMADSDVGSEIRCSDTALMWYGYGTFTLRSEPDGALFESKTWYVPFGSNIVVATYSPNNSKFAYWRTNDVRFADEWGRALDTITFNLPSNDVELVAMAFDDQNERMQYYWYGTTNVTMESDTDGDGRTLAQEIAAGTNPLLADDEEDGWVRYTDSALQWYGYGKFTLRSEPEGVLFDTQTWYVPFGSNIVTETFSADTTTFASWYVRGVRICDEWGRAIESTSMIMPSNTAEIVALACTNHNEQMQYYWYGTTNVTMESDTDGDGFSFAQELANGTNPLIADSEIAGPIQYADGAMHFYNPNSYKTVTIRSELEGSVVATSEEVLSPGSYVATSTYSPSSSKFAYWTRNGKVVRDEWGRAVDSIEFTMSTNAEDLVAVSVEDANERMQYYWYGTTNVTMESDTDGDGYTFAQEIANGTNPLAADSERDGWVKYADGESVDYVQTQMVYTVTFNAMGGTSDEPTRAVPSEDKLGDLPNATRPGFTFDGWFVAEGESEPASPDLVVVEHLTFYAHWTGNEYSIEYNPGQGGNGSMDGRHVVYGDQFALSSNAFARVGYTFIGWTDDPNEINAVKYYDGVSVSNLTGEADGVYTLYAVWQANEYAVRFNANGGDGTMDDQSFLYDSPSALNTNVFVNIGYGFTGWSETPDGEIKYRENAIVSNLTAVAGGVVNLYAQWKVSEYDIVFDANSGSGTMANEAMTYNVLKALTANSFTRTGYVFAGWATAASGSVVYADKATVSNLTAEENGSVTLYAKWAANAYTLKFDANGGTGTMATKAMTYDVPVTLAANTFAKTGYHFSGWATSANGAVAYADKAMVSNLTTAVNGTVTLYAKWAANAYSVVFDANGGTGSMADAAMTYDTPAALAACAFTRTGYTFAGWATTAGGSVTYADKATVSNLTAKENGSVTLYAKWTPNGYVVDYNPGNGGSGAMDDQSMTYDDPDALSSNEFYRVGYTFIGWTDDAEELEEVLYYDGVVVSNLTADLNGEYDLYAIWQANAYAVRFNANVGSGSMSEQDFTYDAEDALDANAFTKTGYHFAGWATSADGSAAYGDGAVVSNLTAAVDGIVDLYATWGANGYSVKFDANGGTGTMANETMTYNVPVTLAANAFTKTGYHFSGWATSANGSVTYADEATVSNLTTTVNGTVTLYAKWTANAYSVVFDANGGSGSMADAAMTYDVPVTLAANTFAKTGYHFSGWATSANGSVTYADKATVSNLTTAVNGTVTLYAKWAANAYSVVFDANGGTGSMADAAMTYDVPVTLVANAFAKTGYHFSGWATSANGSVAYADKATVSNLTAEENGSVALYAKWTPNGYVIDYNPGNGGSGAMDDQSMTYDDPDALSSNEFYRVGYTFIGWTDDAEELEEVLYYDGVVVSNLTADLNGEYDLYAIWQANAYTVRFNANGGSGSVSEQDFTYDAEDALDANAFTRTGYHFAGWATTANGAAVHGDGAVVSNLTAAVDGIVDLYATWGANGYSVKFDANGGSGTMADEAMTYDVPKALTANSFTRTGYVFAGWATAASGSVVYADKASVKNLTATSGAAVTLYAKWTANSYTLKFDANGGTGTMATKAMTYDVPVTLAANTFAKTGYHFSGWATSANGSVAYADKAMVSNLTTAVNGTVTLYAKWAANAYSVVFDANGGTGSMADAAMTYDTPAALAACAFTRTGYTFAGWATTAGGSVQYADKATVSNLTAEENGSVTLYARWTPNGYVVDYNPGNGGSGAMDDQSMTYDAPDALSSNEFYRVGYTFIGWTDDAEELVEVLYYDGVVVSNLTAELNGEYDLYAIWQANEYTVRFNANGGSGSMSEQDFTYDAEDALDANAFTRTGYHFAGWATMANGAAVHGDGAVVSNLTAEVDGIVDLYATWDANGYSVKFVANGGSGTMANEAMTYNVSKALTANAFTKTGYHFSGWATSANGSVTYADEATVSNLTTTVNGTVTLYAKWTANSYTLKFDANGGTGTMATKAMTYDVTVTLAANTFAKTGYHFSGWATSANGSVAYADKAMVSNLTTAVNGTVTLYAKWAANAYSVVFDANGGTGSMANEGHAYDTPAALAACGFTRTGYTFAGWATSANGSVTYADEATVSNLTTAVNGSVTLYAKWTGIVNFSSCTVTPWDNALLSYEVTDCLPEIATNCWLEVLVSNCSTHVTIMATSISGKTNLTAGVHAVVWDWMRDVKNWRDNDVSLKCVYHCCNTCDAESDVVCASSWRTVTLRSSSPEPDGLAHRWSFNGNLTDNAGGLTARAIGNVTQRDLAYILAGGTRGSSYIDLGDVSVPGSDGALTIELWATQISTKYYSHIFELEMDGGWACMEWSLATYINYDELGFPGLEIDNAGYCTHLAPYTLGTEFHIAVVIEKTNESAWQVTFYKQDAVTGKTLKSRAYSKTRDCPFVSDGLARMGLGHNFGGSSENDANASYNEVRLWHRALSEDELSQNVLEGPDADLSVSQTFPMPIRYAPVGTNTVSVFINGVICLTDDKEGIFNWDPEESGDIDVAIVSGDMELHQVISVPGEYVCAKKGHTGVITQPAIEATSGTAGRTAEIRCSRCNELMQAAAEIPALGYIRNVTARQLWPHKKVEVCYDLAEDIGEVAGENTALQLSAGTGPAASGDLTYVNDSTYPWTVDTSTYHSGGSSWKSGNSGHGSTSSSRSVTVSGATKVSFYWRVTSEVGYDKLHFYVDGNEVVSAISGSVGWTQVSYNLSSSSSHTLKWSYTKDGSVDTSPDCGWVDDVVITYATQSYSARSILGDTRCVPGAHRIVWDAEKDGVSVDQANLLFTVAYSTTSNTGTGCVNTTSAVCDGMSVGSTMELGCSAIDAQEGTVKIDDTTVFSVTDGGLFNWQPLTKGVHTLKHIAGTNVWTRTVNVTSLVYEEPTPNPPTAEDANFTISTTVRALTSTAKTSGTIGTAKVDSSYSGTWSATTSADWITLTYATRNVGLPVIYTVAENKGVEARTGYVYVSGHVFTITQPGVGAELDHYLDEFDQNGGEGTLTVLAGSQSGWRARSNVDWISVETLCGTGECEVVYHVAPWAEVSTRDDGTITIAGQTFTVHQTGRPMKLSAESVEKDYLAHDIVLAVDALASTEWGIALDASWLSIVERGSGKGAGTVTLAINENPSYSNRTATALIGTETFTIVQTGRPTEALAFVISPETTTASVKGANGVISVEATPDLPWSATSQASWLTVMPGFSSGAGNGNVVYAATPNPTMAERSGTIRVSPEAASGVPAKTHSVTQPAATSMISVDNHTFAVDGDSFAVEVTVDDVVAWTIVENVDWLSVDGATSRNGPDSVTIAVEPNLSIESRAATIKIAGHEFQVTQRGRTISLEYGETVFPPDEFEEATIEVHPNGEVEWTAVPSDATWISVWSEDENCTCNADGSVSGTGDAALKYMVTAYVGDGEVKTGWITIGNEKIYVSQRAYELSIDPCATNVAGNAGAGTIAVPADVGEVWNAIATEPWIKLVGSYDEVTGSGTVNYTFTDNDTGETRTGKIVIAGEEYTITQAARQLVKVEVEIVGGGVVEVEGEQRKVYTFDRGESVKLTAVASNDWRFVRWEGTEGSVGTEGALTLTADVDREIVAVFEKIPVYTVNGESVVEGTIKSFAAPEPIVMGGTTQLVCLGTSAYPGKGTSFTVTVSGNMSFAWDLWQTNYWVAIEQCEGGTVSGTVGWVAAGAEVTFTAMPEEGKSFYRWLGDAAGSATIWCQGDSIPQRGEDAASTGGGIAFTGGGSPLTTRVLCPFTVSAVFGTFADTLATAADAPTLAFTTGGDAAWAPVIDATAQAGYSSIRSGAIGAESESWVETTVSGAGTLAFRWRTDCEHDDGGGATWDRLAVFVNSVEKARLDGTTAWQSVELPLTDAKSVIRWSFYRDDYDAEGEKHENSGWIDGVEVK